MYREILAAGPGKRLHNGRAPFLPWGHLFVLIPTPETYKRQVVVFFYARYLDTQFAKNISVKKPLAFFHVGINTKKIQMLQTAPAWMRTSHLQRHNCVRVYPFALPQHIKVLKHFIYIKYGCAMQSGVVYTSKHNTMMSFVLTLTPNFPNLAPTS